MRRGFLVVVILILLSACTVCGDASASAAVTVATAGELAGAMEGGAAHIVIVAHLDLSSLPVVNSTGDPAGPADSSRLLFWNPDAVQSIRVRCQATQPC